MTTISASELIPAPYSHFIAWIPLISLLLIQLLWFFPLIRKPGWLPVTGILTNAAFLLVLAVYVLGDYLQTMQNAELILVKIVEKSTHNSLNGTRIKRGRTPTRRYKITYKLPSGDKHFEWVLDYDFDSVEVGDQLPFMSVPDKTGLSVLGDGAPLGVFSWLFSWLLALAGLLTAVAFASVWAKDKDKG